MLRRSVSSNLRHRRPPTGGLQLIDGRVATALAGDTDLAGAARTQGAAIDLGALETAP
jgi:hypothetical protein